MRDSPGGLCKIAPASLECRAEDLELWWEVARYGERLRLPPASSPMHKLHNLRSGECGLVLSYQQTRSSNCALLHRCVEEPTVAFQHGFGVKGRPARILFSLREHLFGLSTPSCIQGSCDCSGGHRLWADRTFVPALWSWVLGHYPAGRLDPTKVPVNRDAVW